LNSDPGASSITESGSLVLGNLLATPAHAFERRDETVDHIFGERHLTNVSRHLLDGDGIDGLLFGKGRIVFVLRDRRLGIVLGRSNLSRQDKG